MALFGICDNDVPAEPMEDSSVSSELIDAIEFVVGEYVVPQ